MFRLSTLCLTAALTAALAVPAFAQPAQTGTIAGVVQDASGGVLPGVTVTITSQERGFVRSAVSDEQGRYVFAAVSIGNYTVEATLAGFAPMRLHRQPGRDREDHDRADRPARGRLTDTVDGHR